MRVLATAIVAVLGVGLLATASGRALSTLLRQRGEAYLKRVVQLGGALAVVIPLIGIGLTLNYRYWGGRWWRPLLDFAPAALGAALLAIGIGWGVTRVARRIGARPAPHARHADAGALGLAWLGISLGGLAALVPLLTAFGRFEGQAIWFLAPFPLWWAVIVVLVGLAGRWSPLAGGRM